MLLFSLFPHNGSAQVSPTNSATISGSVSDSAGKPVADAKVSLSGPRSSTTQSDAHGLFVFVGMPYGMYQISAAAQGLGTAMRKITVEGDTNVAIQYQQLTGGLKVIAQVSSAANAQFNVTPASVTQVNPIANAFEGKTSWRTILEQIPGLEQAGLGNGSAVTYAAYPDGPLVPMKLSINGTLPYETGTLLDDMPLIGGAPLGGLSAGSGTDLSLYPLNGFGIADVVRGPGANAPSIVNSVGGSLVLHPLGSVSKNRYELSLSTDPYGGVVANTLIAVHSNKFAAVMTYGVNDSPGPVNGPSIALTTTFAPVTINGQSFSCTGSCSIFASLGSPNYASSSSPIYGFQTGLLTCCMDFSSAWSQHSGSVGLTYALSPSLNAAFFYAGQTSATATVPGQDYITNFLPPLGYTGGIASGEHFLTPGAEALIPTPIQQVSSLTEEKITAQIGNGVLRFQALQNRNFSTQAFSYGSPSTVQLFGGGSVCSNASVNCSTGTYVPTVFNGATYNVTYIPISGFADLQSNNRDFLVSYAAPLGENLHIGASFVKSYYDVPYQNCLQLGSPFNFSVSGAFPSSVSQTTNEVRIFIGGNPSRKTSLDLSGYFTDANYHVQNPNDLTGNTYVNSNFSYLAPRLGFVWRPTAAVAVRASVGGGFAEAPLSDLVGTNAPFCFGATCTVTVPNLNLQPEKSFAFDLGTDIKLPQNTILSFDVYRTNLYGQLYNSTTVSSSCPVCAGLPLYTTQYGNLSESRYEGILVDLRHTVPHGTYWSLSGGLTRGYVVSVPAGFYNGTTGSPATPCTNCSNLNVVPGVNFNGTFTNGVSVPYAQALGTLGYRWNTDKYVDLVGTYFGNNNTYFRPAFIELDGYAGYSLSKNLSLLLTFRNITGIYDSPTQVITSASLSGAPTISGLPYALFGEEYGPRTLIVTTRMSL